MDDQHLLESLADMLDRTAMHVTIDKSKGIARERTIVALTLQEVATVMRDYGKSLRTKRISAEVRNGG
jgi:hypothetical protein